LPRLPGVTDLRLLNIEKVDITDLSALPDLAKTDDHRLAAHTMGALAGLPSLSALCLRNHPAFDLRALGGVGKAEAS